MYHSDNRWKKDVRRLNGSPDMVMKLREVKYKWRQHEYPEMNFSDCDQIGLTAQDVEEIISEVADESTEEYKSVDYA